MKKRKQKKHKKIRQFKDIYGILKIKKDIEMMYGFEVKIYKPYFFKVYDTIKSIDIYPKNKRYLKCEFRVWGTYVDIHSLIENYFLNNNNE